MSDPEVSASLVGGGEDVTVSLSRLQEEEGKLPLFRWGGWRWDRPVSPRSLATWYPFGPPELSTAGAVRENAELLGTKEADWIGKRKLEIMMAGIH